MDDVTRILILTADTGFGHRSAANAIAAALQEAHGEECMIEIVNPLSDRRVPSVVRRSQTNYDRIVREAPELYRLGYKASEGRFPNSVTEGALTVLLYEVLRDVVRRHRPDAIVSTHPFYAAPLAALSAVQRRHDPLLVVVTDLADVHRVWFQRSVDYCLVATETVRDLALGAGLSADQIRITGIPVHPRLVGERRTPSALRSELGLDPNRKTVLAVGSRRTRKFIGPLMALNHSGLPFQLIVVAGGDDKLHEELHRLEWHVPTRLYNFVEDMAPLMRAADCILCKAGGLVVSESLACGLPLLMVDVLPGQEEGNAARVIEGGAGERGSDPLEVLEILCHWLEHDGALLSVRARKAALLGRPLAAYAVADLAWEAARQKGVQEAPRQPMSRSGVLEMLRRHGVPGS